MITWIQKALLQFDYTAWYYMNTVWHNEFLDQVIPFVRNQYFWGPLYLFLLLFMTMNFGKRGWVWCAAFLVTFAMSDYISASVIKPLFHRTRPCNNPYLQDMLHLLVPRSSGYSFPSTHAANHFSLGIFSAVTLGRRRRWIWAAATGWAVLVSYGQVYVGVHFPMDIFCGALLGTGIGLFTGKAYNRKYQLMPV